MAKIQTKISVTMEETFGDFLLMKKTVLHGKLGDEFLTEGRER